MDELIKQAQALIEERGNALKGPGKWEERWNRCILNMGKELGLISKSQGKPDPGKWNSIINALDEYDPLWRGYEVQYTCHPSKLSSKLCA